MIKAFKLPLFHGKYKIIDEIELIDLAKRKIEHSPKLAKKYHNIELGRMTALAVFKAADTELQTVYALKIKKGVDNFALKTIDCIEKDIEKAYFNEDIEKTEIFDDYMRGSKEAMVKIIEDVLKYELTEDEDDSVEDFLDHETFFTTTVFYKQNRIEVEIAKRKFIINKKEQTIHKYDAIIVDKTGYKFKFEESELFRFREEAVNGAKKLIDEHYKLAERNSKVEKIVVKKDKSGTLIVFWPDEKVEKEGNIKANDLIGEFDLAAKTEASMDFFDSCTEATTKEIMIAKKVIRNCLNLKTYTAN